MDLTATYSPEDNKLRLYSTTRLDTETYARVKAAGFSWAPKQQLFVAPQWTPGRADLLMELCGSIEDEDKSLVQRSMERAERFEDYSESRAKDAEQARKRVDSIVEHIPFGQPILVGHHSEKRARKDAERIDQGMRKSIKMWDTSEYWTRHAESAIATAKYKERPEVRVRRIRKIEAEQRKMEHTKSESERFIKAWSKPRLTMEMAAKIANHDGGYFLNTSERTDGKAWPVSLWDVTQGRHEPQPTVDEIARKAIRNHEKTIAWADRWLEHYGNRLAYERTMLVADGGIVADKTKPEVGGACKCWASHGGWSLIQKVNKVSVTLLDSWGNGGGDFTRTIPFDKLFAVMSRAEVETARQEGRLIEECPRGFLLGPKAKEAESVNEAAQPTHEEILPSQSPPNSGGIQTPHGPITRNPDSKQPELFKRQSGQTYQRGMGL